MQFFFWNVQLNSPMLLWAFSIKPICPESDIDSSLNNILDYQRVVIIISYVRLRPRIMLSSEAIHGANIN